MSLAKSACPDAELLASCADGQLAADERQSILRHLTVCAACHEVFVEALHFDDELQRVPTPEVQASTAERDGQARAAAVDRRGARGRWRLAALVPIAATVAWTVGLLVEWPGAPLSPSPLTARAPSPSPSPSSVATQAAAELVDGPLPAGALLELALVPPTSFARRDPSADERCRFIGFASVQLEVWARHDPEEAEAERRKLRARKLDVDNHTCVEDHGETYRAARAVAWARFAALTRSQKLLAHVEVRQGLAGRNVSDIPRLDGVARLVDVCARQPTNQDWESLRDLSQDLVESWLL